MVFESKPTKRILHFTNIPFTVEQITSGGRGLQTGGSWMAALIGRMLQQTNFNFACIAFGNTQHVEISQDNRITCFVIPRQSESRSLQVCYDLIHEWEPDLIHIHGTERGYGLLAARGMIPPPVVISLQGLLGPYSEWYHYFGNRNLMDIIRMHRWLELPVLRGQWKWFLDTRKMARREKEIILGNRFFMGRTRWDQAYINALNPSAHYFHAGELLREAFWKKLWQLDQVQRHRIIFTNAGHPRKGTETLLDAVSLLRENYPNIQVCIAGYISLSSGYGRYIRRRLVAMDGVAVELGQLNAEQMATELALSHVFVSPSFIDNSPNAVCEAQLIGMPVISSYTGGVPSLIEEGKTGLFFPTGDVPMLAARLREIFNNDTLATELGAQGQKVARMRHEPLTVVQQTLSAYERVLSEASAIND